MYIVYSVYTTVPQVWKSSHTVTMIPPLVVWTPLASTVTSRLVTVPVVAIVAIIFSFNNGAKDYTNGWSHKLIHTIAVAYSNYYCSMRF